LEFDGARSHKLIGHVFGFWVNSVDAPLLAWLEDDSDSLLGVVSGSGVPSDRNFDADCPGCVMIADKDFAGGSFACLFGFVLANGDVMARELWVRVGTGLTIALGHRGRNRSQRGYGSD
jgi:hypothetical protein